MVNHVHVNVLEQATRTLDRVLSEACGRAVRLTPDGCIHPDEARRMDAELAPSGLRVDRASILNGPNAVLNLIPIEPVFTGSAKTMADLTAEARDTIAQSARVLACWDCVTGLWTWLRRRMRGKPRGGRGPNFYDHAGKDLGHESARR